MASHHGCLKPPLHILPPPPPPRFVTFSTCLSPLAWYLLTGSPPSSSLSPNHPLLPILYQIIGPSHSLINFLKSTFIPFSLVFVCLLFSTHSILSLLESNPSVCGVFLDLKKPFDSVPHQPLLDLLASHNLPPHLLNWIHSYLLNRSQAVVVNGSTSPSLPVSSGVPQGSILGPLLFLIYINGVTDIPL